MADASQLKVSYCTTCKGRLHHLMETLPKNLNAERHNPNVEFVVLSYGRDEALDSYIRNHFQSELQSGRLKYAVYPEAKYFRVGHAKNMAHRVASGDILVNLDADNTIVANFSKWLQQKIGENSKQVITHHVGTWQSFIASKIVKCQTGKAPWPEDGRSGRLALTSSAFEDIGGYDERFEGWGGDENNLGDRAYHKGYHLTSIPKKLWGGVIGHSLEERLSNLSAESKNETLSRIGAPRLKRMAIRVKSLMVSPEMTVNPGGNIGCGSVYINFSQEPHQIEPLKAKEKDALSYTFNNPQVKNDWGVLARASDAHKGMQSPG